MVFKRHFYSSIIIVHVTTELKEVTLISDDTYYQSFKRFIFQIKTQYQKPCRDAVFIKTFEGVIFLTALKRFLTIFDNLYFQGGQLPDHPGQIPDHPGQVPDLPTFEVVRFLSTLPRFLTRVVRFLTNPKFKGGQVPDHPGQEPDHPEKVNSTKILETGLKLNFSKF